MGSAFDGVDENDPCQMWRALQRVHDRLLAGEMVVEARFGADAKRWQQADRAGLAARIEALKAECAARQGLRRTRFAKTFRFRPS